MIKLNIKKLRKVRNVQASELDEIRLYLEQWMKEKKFKDALNEGILKYHDALNNLKDR